MFNEFDQEKLEELIDQDQMLSVEYPLVEDFYTIQGEGAHTGRPAYFIRTAGCDVNCWWCDVKESWDEEEHPPKTVEEIEIDEQTSEKQQDKTIGNKERSKS